MQTTLNKVMCSSLHKEFKHRKHGSSIALLSGLLECMVTVLLPITTSVSSGCTAPRGLWTSFATLAHALLEVRGEAACDDGAAAVHAVDDIGGDGGVRLAEDVGRALVPAYRNGYFGVSMKVQPGYTAGVNTAFYLSNAEVYPGYHDEIDVELLGTIPGEPYTLQTNVYVRGTGDARPIVGREMRFHLWFDPAAAFHHYAVLWNPDEIVFLVDDVPVRRYQKKVEATFPEREMWAYGSVWDASDWATDNGRYRADYRYQPFVSGFREFKVAGCEVGAPASCRPVAAGPGGGLSAQQGAAMRWAQQRSMVYYYCQDGSKDRSNYPEC